MNILKWQTPQNNSPVNGLEIADHYQINWSMDGINFNAPIIVNANGQDMYIQSGLTNGVGYYYTIQAISNNVASTPSPVKGPYYPGTGMGSHTVSGVVNVPVAPSGPLYVGLYNGSAYAVGISLPSQGLNAYAITGVPDGNYTAFAMLDQNNSGQFNTGNLIVGVNDGPQFPVVVNGSDMTQNLNLAIGNATAIVSTMHQSDGTNDNYNLDLEVQAQQKLPVNVALINGPNVAYPVDYSSGGNSKPGVFSQWASTGSVRPGIGDTYTFAVTYADGSTETLSQPVNAVLDSFAQNLSVTNTPSMNTPTFGWTAPSTPPPYYTYTVGVSQQNGGQVWDYPKHGNNMPSTQTSVQFNTDSSAYPSSLVNGTTYNWNVSVVDANNNQAQYLSSYTPGGVMSLYAISGNVSGAVSNGVGISLSGASSGSTVTDGSGNYSFSGLSNGAYTVMPSLAGYTFNPSIQSININGGNLPGVNFSSISNSVSQTYNVSGQVTGAVVNGVTINLSGASSGSTVTDINGNYSFAGLINGGSYTVTPSDNGYTFTPPNQPFIINGANQNGVSFISNAPSATGDSVSGTINYGGSHTGWIYVGLFDQYGNTTGYGTSISSPGAFTIRGVPPGTYMLAAGMDIFGYGAPSASDPQGAVGPVIVNGTMTGQNITLVDQTPPAPVTPKLKGISPGDQMAVIKWETPRNLLGQEIADHYNIYWGTDTGASNGGIINVPADGQGVYFQTGLTNGTNYYYKVSAITNTIESPASSVVGPVTAGAGAGYTLSGTVNVPATPAGPLYVGVRDTFQNVYYMTEIVSPVSGLNTYSVSGVPSGSYGALAFLDQNGDHQPDTGDLTAGRGKNEIPVVVNGAGVTQDFSLGIVNGTATVSTIHGTDGSNNGYSLVLRTDAMQKLPVNVALVNGPNVPAPVDMQPSGNANPGTLQTMVNVGPVRPNAGDNYTFAVTYADGSSENLSAQVTAVLDSFPTNLGVANTPSANVPTFSWSAPAAPPAFYTYNLGVRQLTGGQGGWSYPGKGGMPDTQTSVQYNTDGSANPTSLVNGTTYGWQAVVQDVNGNQAQYLAIYTPGGASTYSVSGTVSGGANMVINLSGFSNGSTITDSVGNYSFIGLPNGTYTVTPSVSGFTPSSQTVTINGANVTGVNFTAASTYSISGTVSGGANMVINLSGFTNGSTATDSGGNYTFIGLPNGTYTVTPSVSGFTPSSQTVTINGANVTGVNFTAASVYSISGNVSNNNGGGGAQGVTMALIQNAVTIANALTDGSGNFAFSNVPDGTYTITPSLPGGSATFIPSSQVAIVNGSGVNNINFQINGGYDISGTVSYGGAHTGWIYINLLDQNGNSTGHGTSISSAGAFTIRGVPPGTYAMNAGMDILGYGVPNAIDPQGSAGPVIVNGTMAGQNITITDQPFPATVTPTLKALNPTDQAVFIQWKPAYNAGNEEIADHYKIYWGTDTGASNGGIINVPANGQNMYVQSGLSNGTQYYYKMTAVVNGAESASTAVDGPVTVGPAGPYTVSGTVTVPSGTTGPLYVGVYDDNAKTIYATKILSPVTGANPYSVPGISNGTYGAFAFVDNNNDGQPDIGDLTTGMNNRGIPVVVNGADMTQDLSVGIANATEMVSTSHQFDGANNNYSLNLELDGMEKLPVNVALVNGPNVPYPADMSPGGNDKPGTFRNWVNIGSVRPNIGDAYTFAVTYSDGTTETLSASVNAVLDSFATNLGVTNSPNAFVPTFNWTAPAAPPAYYTYNISVGQQNGGQVWSYPNKGDMPSAQTSVQYNTDGSANPSSLVSGTAYNWQVSVQDANGNQAQYQSAYTPSGTQLYTVSGYVSGTVVNGVTMTLSGSSNATTTTDASGYYSFTGLANGVSNSYTVTPSLAGYTFNPPFTPDIYIYGADVTGVNFTSTGVCSAPGGISVPSSNTTGTFTIYWYGGTSGAIYVLDESSDGGATWTNIYTGTNTSYTVAGLASGNYQFRVKDTKAGYADSAYLISSPCAVTLNCTTPGGITVPSSNSTGSFTIYWYGGTSGATYMLDESSDGGATWTNIYTGTNTSYTVAGLASGNYKFRVKATKAGYADSAYVVSTTCAEMPTCTTPGGISVPSSNTTGTFTIYWYGGASGATYMLDESSDGGATWTNIYAGTNTFFTVTGLVSGNYQFRVKDTKAGYADSAYVVSTPCAVTLTCAAPGGISVPSTNTTGTFTIYWYGGTSGATYMLDESADGGATWTNIYSGTNTFFTVTGLASGNYKFRLKDIKTGYTDSAYLISTSCAETLTCAAPGGISVPSTNTTGTFTIYWYGGTSGATYVLDESADGGATWTNVYSGKNTFFTVSGLASGNYKFRLKDIKTGYTDSSYIVSGTVTVN